MTFEEISKIWMKRAICGVTYSYQCEIQYTLNHLNKHIGKKPVEEITWIDIEDVMFDLARMNPNTKKPASQKLLKNIRNCASNVMDFAIDCNMIQNNPVRKKRLPRTVPAEKRRALTLNERELIVKTNHRLRLPVLIMLFAGLRTNEVIPLEFKDFDKSNGILIINKSVSKVASNKYTIKSGTKNGKSRTVPIPQILIDEIETAKSQTKSNLITSQINGDLHTPSSWKSSWNSYINALNYTAYNGERAYCDPHGIPKVLGKITAHMLRHTYATMLHSARVDPLTAKELMGHSNISVTLEIYTHIEEATKIQDIQNYNNYINEHFVNIV